MLAVAGIDAFYGRAHILAGVGLAVARGEVLALLGRNGAGKSTTLKSLMGVVTPRSGYCCGAKVAWRTEQPRAGRAKRGLMSKFVVALRKWAATPLVKYALIAVAGLLWLMGLGDQIPDPAQMAKYVGLSLLIAAVATV
jgi:ABC-type cobalamin/Fe3+-siderophores transport system ATPase subunit